MENENKDLHIEPDIQEALQHMEGRRKDDHLMESAEDYTSEVAVAAPPGKDCALKSGLCSGSVKVLQTIREKPLHSIVGLFAVIGSSMVCPYFGVTVLAGLMAWAIQRKS